MCIFVLDFVFSAHACTKPDQSKLDRYETKGIRLRCLTFVNHLSAVWSLILFIRALQIGRLCFIYFDFIGIGLHY